MGMSIMKIDRAVLCQVLRDLANRIEADSIVVDRYELTHDLTRNDDGAVIVDHLRLELTGVIKS